MFILNRTRFRIHPKIVTVAGVETVEAAKEKLSNALLAAKVALFGRLILFFNSVLLDVTS